MLVSGRVTPEFPAEINDNRWLGQNWPFTEPILETSPVSRNITNPKIPRNLTLDSLESRSWHILARSGINMEISSTQKSKEAPEPLLQYC